LKVAAGLHKPDGLDVITGETIREIYVQLDRYDSHYRHFILAKKNDCHNADSVANMQDVILKRVAFGSVRDF